MPALPVLLDRLAGAVEKSAALDGVAEAIQKVTSLIPQGVVKDTLSGTQIGHPAHPLLVAVPIGTFTGALALDLTGERDASRTLIGVGLLTAIPTTATGWSDWSETNGAERRVGLVHALANAAGLALFAASYLARRRGGSGQLLAVAGYSAMGVGGWLGGHLTYAMGVGVDTTAFEGFPTEWADVCADTDLVPGEPFGGHADGEPVLLMRDGTAIRAIADRCSHRGAPLHEGPVEDGCIVCPWHQSRFSLVDGTVQQGPATRLQEPFEVRVLDGRVQVRRDEERSLRKNPVS